MPKLQCWYPPLGCPSETYCLAPGCPFLGRAWAPGRVCKVGVAPRRGKEGIEERRASELPEAMGFIVPHSSHGGSVMALSHLAGYRPTRSFKEVSTTFSSNWFWLLLFDTFLNADQEYLLLQCKLIICPLPSKHEEEIIIFSEAAFHVFKDFCP